MTRTKHDLSPGGNVPAELDDTRPKGDQVREILETLAAAVGPGGLLPSERALADRYGVARMTVRQEMNRLVTDGVAVRRPGGGTYVAEPNLARVVIASSFSRNMRARGLEPGARVLEFVVVPATALLAEQLECRVGDPVLRLARLRTADGEPMALERTRVSLVRFPGLEEVDFGKASLYDELEDRFGVVVGSVSASVSAVLPDADDAHMLRVTTRQPCLAITSAPRSRSGEVIEAGRSLYRPDRYELTINYRP